MQIGLTPLNFLLGSLRIPSLQATSILHPHRLIIILILSQKLIQQKIHFWLESLLDQAVLPSIAISIPKVLLYFSQTLKSLKLITITGINKQTYFLFKDQRGSAFQQELTLNIPIKEWLLSFTLQF